MVTNNNQQQNGFNLIEFRLPDSTVSIPTWSYIIAELTPFLEQLKFAIDTQNTALAQINSRIEYWLSKQPTQQGG